MHERSLVSVKGEPHSTSSLNSALFDLASILFTCLKFTCVNVRSQKRVNGNQRNLNRNRAEITVLKFARDINFGSAQKLSGTQP